MTNSVTVSQLFMYPVKSAAGITVAELPLDRRGPQWDRRWMLVDEHGQFITQRQLPAMAMITVAMVAGGIELTVPDQAPLSVLVNELNDDSSMSVTVWSDEVQAVDCGDSAAALLSSYLGRAVRLVFMPESTERRIDPDYDNAAQTVSFADGFPLLLISESSLQRFNEELERPITMERFRPNLVVSGCEAFAEDQWRSFTISGIQFDVVKPCSRCVIPSIDPATGVKDNSILKALASSRRIFADQGDHAAYFGQNVIARGVGTIRLGEAVSEIRQL